MNRKLLFIFYIWCVAIVAHAEDGSRLWLPEKVAPSASEQTITPASETTQVITRLKSTPMLDVAVSELKTSWQGKTVVLEKSQARDIKALGKDGYKIALSADASSIRLISAGETGLLYAAYHLLRLPSLDSLPIEEKPAYDLRLLNHWDNMDRTVERGYAGQSLWDWESLPAITTERYVQYARANASIGINGTVLNNVNASPKILTQEYLQKVKALADVFRPYGIKVYLSVNFATPMSLGELSTADPLDKSVRQWWKNKVKAIYTLIPDFGGFLVKANSEGQPGPCDFGRTHADGANMLADALKSYNGIVMWRAFVYSPIDKDRAKQAYLEFEPLDGQFRDNVIIQIKNGPVDFQPREPYSPLFTAMHHTRIMPELQITQEYLGHSNHLAFLATMWSEFFDDVTTANGMLTQPNDKMTAIAGVANIGTDTNWCGYVMAQANWYAFGRMAWNPEQSAESIAKEWLQQTFHLKAETVDGSCQTDKPQLLSDLTQMMMMSREAVVDYMMPMGLHHLFAWGHHYGPEPWCAVKGARADWLPTYYHRADAAGLGFDRSHTGSNAVAQYPEPLARKLDDIKTCPIEYLLWFHHIAWNEQLSTGRTMWQELCYHYDRGVQSTRTMQKLWDEAYGYVDAELFTEVQRRLRIQTRDAQWWKDGCLLYFQQFSQQPFPTEMETPVHNLDNLEKVHLPITNYECPTERMLDAVR